MAKEHVEVALEEKVTFRRGHRVLFGWYVLRGLLPLFIHGSRRRLRRLAGSSGYLLQVMLTIG